MWFVGAIPLWNFVSRYSKNLLADGFVYDLILLLSYVGTLIYLGEASKFNVVQWIGLVFCILGITLIKS